MALDQGANWLDLGGNNVVSKQRALDDLAKSRGECYPRLWTGPWYGLNSWLGSYQRFPGADNIELRVGGLPAVPVNQLGYQLVFSARELINEYREPCTVLRDGRLQDIPPLTETESSPWVIGF